MNTKLKKENNGGTHSSHGIVQGYAASKVPPLRTLQLLSTGSTKRLLFFIEYVNFFTNAKPNSVKARASRISHWWAQRETFT